MPTFSYNAIDEAGARISGDIDADTSEMATNFISSQGYIPLKVAIKKTSSEGFSFLDIAQEFTAIDSKELILFTKQFRTMLQAGVPMMKLLSVFRRQIQNPKLKEIVISMSQDIKQGSSLYEAFSKYPKVFSKLYCNMIKAGERSGSLPDVFERLIYIIEHEHKVKSDIKSAMLYPAVVIITLVIAFFVLLTYVIPKFSNIFQKADIELPLPTKISMFMYNTLTDYKYLFLTGIVVAIMAAILYLKTEQGKYIKDLFFLKIPVFGALFIKAAMSRFASIFAILQASGVPILEAMPILSGTIGNVAISREINDIKSRLEAGKGIASPLQSAKYFTPMMVDMIAIGEESGNLIYMLKEISSHYDDEVDFAIKRLSDVIGPVLVICLAVLVGFFALSVFLPMWDMTKMVR